MPTKIIKTFVATLPLLAFFTLPVAVQAQFDYTTNYTYITNNSVITTNGSITITLYTGSGGAVTIPNSTNELPVTCIGPYAFAYCSSLTSVTIPNSVINIGEDAFENCFSLAGVTISNGVASIKEEAFQNCISLISVIIPDSVTNIGEQTFSDCPSLTNISVNAANPAYTSSNGVLFDKTQDALVQYPCGLVNKSYIIPNSVTSIDAYAFWDCTSLTSMTIPNNVTNIGASAFGSCSSLVNLTIGNGVTDIGAEAFDFCFNLTSVTIPASVTSIGESAFSTCDLTSVTIPNGVTNIGGFAFGCSSLTSISVNAANPAYSSSNGVLFDKTQNTLIEYPCGLTSEAYAIPNTVTSVGTEAFYGCNSLTGVTIPNSLTSAL